MVVTRAILLAWIDRLVLRVLLAHTLLRLGGLRGCTRLCWLLWLVQLGKV